jgi:hypothetical protein
MYLIAIMILILILYKCMQKQKNIEYDSEYNYSSDSESYYSSDSESYYSSDYDSDNDIPYTPRMRFNKPIKRVIRTPRKNTKNIK